MSVSFEADPPVKDRARPVGTGRRKQRTVLPLARPASVRFVTGA